MKNTYSTWRHITCPVDGACIRYTIKLVSKSVIKVEHLNRVLDSLAAIPTMQEPFTEALAQVFPLADIETVGTHSGVTIVCEA